MPKRSAASETAVSEFGMPGRLAFKCWDILAPEGFATGSLVKPKPGECDRAGMKSVVQSQVSLLG